MSAVKKPRSRLAQCLAFLTLSILLSLLIVFLPQYIQGPLSDYGFTSSLGKKDGLRDMVMHSSSQTSLSPAKVLEVASKLDPEVIKYAPKEKELIDKSMRTPCYKREDSVLCAPSLYLMGSFQAGVNSFYEKLKAHEDIVTGEASRYQFWGEEPQAKTMKEFGKKNGLSLSELSKPNHHRLLLDGSSSTFAFYWSAGLRAHQGFQSVMKPCWAKCNANQANKTKCMTTECYPQAMKADMKVAEDLGVSHMNDLHLPVIFKGFYQGLADAHQPKLIVLLRNPIDRLHSAYYQYHHYNNKYGNNAEGFLAYCKEQIGAMKKCEARGFSPEAVALYFEALGTEEEVLFFHADQIIRGMYALFLEQWLRYFPKGVIKVVRSEAYFNDPMAVMVETFGFLGLKMPRGDDLHKIKKVGNSQKSSTTGKPMLKEAEDLLKAFYAPWNQRLAKLLDDDRFLWLDE